MSSALECGLVWFEEGATVETKIYQVVLEAARLGKDKLASVSKGNNEILQEVDMYQETTNRV